MNGFESDKIVNAIDEGSIDQLLLGATLAAGALLLGFKEYFKDNLQATVIFYLILALLLIFVVRATGILFKRPLLKNLSKFLFSILLFFFWLVAIYFTIAAVITPAIFSLLNAIYLKGIAVLIQPYFAIVQELIAFYIFMKLEELTQ
ncbi:hypothetical protein HYV43_06275 [Candidatus Micrarchaeota archaeon]|nr:hypothetical protein [Candidatus Micrarchaeota archaeon]